MDKDYILDFPMCIQGNITLFNSLMGNRNSLQKIVCTDEDIQFYDDEGECFLTWVDDEWKEDPESVIPAIINAVTAFFVHGPSYLKELI